MNTRRTLLASSGMIGAGALLTLAGCNGNPLNGPAKIDITTAKMWAQEVTSAADNFAKQALTQAGTVITPAVAADVQKAVATLDAANAAFQGLASGTTDVKTLVLSIIQMLQSLVTMLGPIFPPLASVMPEVDIAVMVLTAFVNEVAMVVPPVPAALHRAALGHG